MQDAKKIKLVLLAEIIGIHGCTTRKLTSFIGKNFSTCAYNQVLCMILYTNKQNAFNYKR